MADKSLVIVESPAKAATISKYLGKEYIVKSSVGHVRKLSAGQKAIDRKDWNMSYEIDPKKTKVVKELKSAAKGVEDIFLATDLDREGEAIAWHLKEILGKKYNYIRIRFNEITKTAIKNAFDNPSKLNQELVNSQMARRALDRIVGFDLSEILWSKIGGYKKYSAGRVQSVAVRLVVEKEMGIKAFTPEEYWEIEIEIKHDDRNIRFKLNTKKSNLEIKNESEALELANKFQGADLEIIENEKKKRKVSVRPPFITSTMQQSASSFLGYSLKKTNKLAQDLYTGGYITYIRTDSPNISVLAQNNCKQYLLDTYGEAYSTPRNFTSKSSNSQEAHEAIRPTDVTFKTDELSLSEDHKKLYKLIWDRFVASQMPQPELSVNSIKAKIDNNIFETSLSSISFDGFYKVMPPSKSSGYVDYELSGLDVGINKTIELVDKSQHFTKPPSRYSEASLVKELEKKGIGRPSTYQETITTIQDRGYVRSENKRLYATKIANLVTDRLQNSFKNIMDYGFTAEMEKNLDKVAEGKEEWKKLLEDFNKLLEVDKNKAKEVMKINSPIETEIECESCGEGKRMLLRTGANGQFLGCEGFSLKGEKQCKETNSLISVDLFSDDDEKEAESMFNKIKCNLCGSAMDGFIIDENKKLNICSNSPICSGTKFEKGEFIKPKNGDEELIDCHKCDAKMELKLGSFGKYFQCQNSECITEWNGKITTRAFDKKGKLKPISMDPVKLEGIKNEKTGDFYVLREGFNGLWMGASKNPIKDKRIILVKEVIPVLEKIPEKYNIFSSAPTADPEGDDLVIRFDKKDGSHYLSSELNGKKKKWIYVYEDGSWKEKLRS